MPHPGTSNIADIEERVATASLFPAGWSIEERIGWPLSKVHGPVPHWQEKLHKPVEQ